MATMRPQYTGCSGSHVHKSRVIRLRGLLAPLRHCGEKLLYRSAIPFIWKDPCPLLAVYLTNDDVKEHPIATLTHTSSQVAGAQPPRSQTLHQLRIQRWMRYDERGNSGQRLPLR